MIMMRLNNEYWPVGENNQYGSPQQERVMAEAICDNSFYFIPLGGRKIQTKDGDYVNK